MPNPRLLYILFAFYLTFLGGGAYYALVFPIRVMHHVLISVLFVAWLWRRWRKDGIPHTDLNTPIYTLLGISFISVIFAQDPRMAFEHLWFGITHWLLFWFGVRRIQRGDARILFEVVLLISVLIVFITGLEFGSWYFGWGILPNTEIGWLEQSGGQLIPPLSALPNAALAMSVSTLLAAYVAPLITLCIGRNMTLKRPLERRLLWLLTLALGVVLFLTSSRGGGLSLIAGLGVFALVRALQTPRFTQLIRPVWLISLSTLLGIGLLAGFVALTFNRGSVSNAGRLDMARGALVLVSQDPLTGVGYGQFGRAFREVRDVSIAQDKLASAHNLYLNTLAELGILGAGVVLWLGYRYLRAVYQRWRTCQNIQERILLEASNAALFGIAIHSLVDVFSITPIVLLVIILTAYSLTPTPTSRLQAPPQGNRWAAGILLVVMLVYGIAFIQFDRAQSAYMSSFNASTIEEARQATQTARELDPYLTLYSLHDAYIMSLNGQLTPATEQALQQALQQVPTWDVAWARLAWLYEQAGELERAQSALEQGMNINQRTTLQIHWARLAEQTQSATPERILAAYQNGLQQAYNLNKQLPYAEFWRATPLRQQATNSFIQTLPPSTRQALEAVWAGTNSAPSPITIARPQEFAAVLYSRPAIFVFPEAYDYPE